MKNRFKVLSLLAASTFAIAMVPSSARATSTAALYISSDTWNVTIPDNGLKDSLNAVDGVIFWQGKINGWQLAIAVGLTKPESGSAVSPNMDLTVLSTGTGGKAPLTVKFTDTDFGPTTGSLVSFVSQNPGDTSVGTFQVYLDTGNTQFGGVLQGNSIADDLAGPYSLTLVDTFTVGSISSDHRLTSLPDGGTTVALLGFAVMGVEALRRRVRSK